MFTHSSELISRSRTREYSDLKLKLKYAIKTRVSCCDQLFLARGGRREETPCSFDSRLAYLTLLITILNALSPDTRSILGVSNTRSAVLNPIEALMLRPCTDNVAVRRQAGSVILHPSTISGRQRRKKEVRPVNVNQFRPQSSFRYVSRPTLWRCESSRALWKTWALP